MYRVRGHLIADLDPLSAEPRPPASRARPHHLRPDLVGPRPRVRGRRAGGAAHDPDAGRGRSTSCATRTAARCASSTCTSRTPSRSGGSSSTSRVVPTTLVRGRAAPHPRPAERGRGLRALPPHPLRGAEAIRPRRRRVDDRAPRRRARRGRRTPRIAEAVLGMAHRGRLNVLANIVGKSYGEIFREFEGDLDPDSVQGSGDVKYHKGATGKFVARIGIRAHRGRRWPRTRRTSRPSTPWWRAWSGPSRTRLVPTTRFEVLSVLVHGDAAFAGQGVVAETLELSQLTGYRTGGTIHVVVNNQLGFTTAPESARSSVYPTDVAKIVQAPIIPRERRRPRSVPARRAPGVRLPPGVPQGRGRSTSSATGATATTRATTRATPSRGCTRSSTRSGRCASSTPSPRAARRHHPRARPRQALEDFQAAPAGGAGRDAPDRGPAHRPAGAAGAARGDSARADGRGPRRARAPGRPTAIARARGLHPAPEARAPVRPAGQDAWPTARWTGRSVRRSPWARSCSREPTCGSSGQDTRRGTFSQRHAVLVDHDTGEEWVPLVASRGRGCRALRGPRLAAVGVRGARIRVRLLGGVPRRPGGVGGAVRRLRQRRPDHHRQLPRGRRRQVGPALGPRAAAPPRLRRPGARALLGAHRAVPHPVRTRQHAPGPTHDRGAVLPPPALPGARHRPAPAPGRVHAQVAAAGPPVTFAARRPDGGLVRRGARRPRRHRGGRRCRAPDRIDPGAVHRVLLCSGKVAFDAMARREALLGGERGSPSRVSTRRRWPWCASSSSIPGPKRPWRRCWATTRTPSRWCGSRRSPRTWGRGPSPTDGCTGCSGTASPSAT